MKSSIKKILLLGLLTSPLVILLQNPSGFPFPSPGAEYSDFSISHYPNMLYLKREIVDNGSIPFWSPAIFSGYPFAANPLSGLWYPLGWIALFFPLPLGLNLVAAFHLLWGGLGLFYLLKSEGLSDRAAIFGALAFEFSPKLFAHYGAGHLTLYYAVSWTPWLLWAVRKARNNGMTWRMVPPVIAALICLADPRWAAYSGMIWVIYAAAYSRLGEIWGVLTQRNTFLERVKQLLKPFAIFIIRLLPQILISVLLASPILIPLIEYTRLSTRPNMTTADILQFSLPPGRLLGLLYPDYGGNHELMVYSGCVVLTLVVVSIFRKGKQSQERFWLWISLFSLVYALGVYLPTAEFFAMLPGFSLLRVPSRSLFLTSMAFAIIAAYSVDALQRINMGGSKQRILLVLMALVVFAGTLSGGLSYITKEFQLTFVVGAVLLMITSLWVGLGLDRRMPDKYWYAGLILIALIDWGAIDSSVISFHEKENVIQEQEEVAAYLAEQDGRFRVYSPSYSLPQQVAMDYRIELADGVDPLHLEVYAEYMDNATGVPREGYQVTIPPFKNGDPPLDNQDYLPDPVLLGFLNVGYVVSEYDLSIPGLAFRNQIGETRVYENMESLARAWVQPEGDILGSDIQNVEITSWEPNRVKISASGPGLLVLSEIMYPGWTVRVDGEDAQILSTGRIFRAVSLGEGDHEIAFIYQPGSIQLGLVLFLFGLITALIYSRKGKKTIHR